MCNIKALQYAMLEQIHTICYFESLCNSIVLIYKIAIHTFTFIYKQKFINSKPKFRLLQ